MGAMIPTPLLVEQRFPLDLDESDAAIRLLYEDSKADRWDPFRDFDWSVIRASVTDPTVRQALRLAYSRRAWHEYTGLSETPAVLIRFCLEAGREADPKYFLTVRNTEEAWHIECFHAVAKAAGGPHPEPHAAAFGAVFNARRHQLALDAESSLDAYVVTYCAFEDEIELRLAQASLSRSAADPLRAMWRRIVTDRERHARFGWIYAARRAPVWGPSTRDAILNSLADYVESRLFSGYQLASLAPAGVADEYVDAESVLERAQLGGVPAALEREVLRSSLAEARQRLGLLGLTVPAYVHPVHGSF